MIRTARIYKTADREDGWRVLVDRLWPRGLKKEAAKLNEWMKEIGPSNTLRNGLGINRNAGWNSGKDTAPNLLRKPS